MKKTKLAAAVLTATLVIGTGVVSTGSIILTPTQVHAANTAQPNSQTDFKWSYNDADNTATITGMNIWAGQGNNSATVVIPDTVTNDGKTYKVTEIGENAFSFQDNMTSVTLPKYLTAIDKNAFGSLGSLTNVDFSQATSLKTIGDNAFQGLKQTSPIVLPDSVTSIGAYAFVYGATSEVTLGQNTQEIGTSAFSVMDNLDKVNFNSNLVTIGSRAFANNKILANIDLSPATSLTTIKDGAFAYSALDSTITLPKSLETIGTQAFAGNKITGVTFDEALKTIDTSAFAYNKIDGTVTIPKSTTSVGIQAFVGNLITKVNVSGNSAVGTDAFSQNQISQIANPSGSLSAHGAIGQSVTITAQQPTLSINDLFTINTNGKTNMDIDISNLTDGVTYDKTSGKFSIPAGVKQFSFSWTLQSNGNTIYSGSYTVFREIPKFDAVSSTIYIGDTWKPADNYRGQDLDKLTVTVKDASGNTIPTVNTTKAGNYFVTYSYGNDSTTIIVTVAKRSATYSLNGSQTVAYNGQTQQPTLSNYSVNLSAGGSYTLQSGDIAVKNNAATPGTYEVYLTQAGIDHINSQFGNTYELTQGSSSASFIITDAANGTLSGGSKTYDGKSASSSYTQPKFTATDSTGETIGTMDLSASDYQFESDGSNAGSYKIKLTTAGINAIKAKYPNYMFNELEKVEATYTINPVTDVHLSLSGGSKTYDGKKVSESNFTPKLIINDKKGNNIATIELSAGQYNIKNESVKYLV
ncbi:leucine-rich repeat protein [Lentilactobacillus otakiensis]|uniref:leucine-rich repeat protein n=1 Tax=Lentilactobacillus otakiensis TaxID=481720 RepID=UPI003D1670ED